jgi:hypothetical protein
VLNQTVSLGSKVLPRTVQMNTDLRGVMSSLNDLVADPSTLTSLNRLGDTFNTVQDAGQKIVPAQTVCNYFTYWTAFISSHFSLPTPFGYAERVVGPAIAGSSSPNTLPRNPMDNYSGGQGDGRFSSNPVLVPPADQGVFSPLNSAADAHDGIPILHGEPYGPTVTDGKPNCQSGQVGYPLGETLLPGQSPDNPTFGPSNISKAGGVPPLGKTDLFLTQNGDRLFWDSANNPPENP